MRLMLTSTRFRTISTFSHSSQLLRNRHKSSSVMLGFDLSLLAFVGSSLLVTSGHRRKARRYTTIGSTTTTAATSVGTNQPLKTKEDISNQRGKHFMKCVTVSYANSGGLMMMEGRGARLFDETGRSYLDTRNNVCHVGHCHPRVVHAVSQQVAKLNTNTRYLHPNVCELAERLCAELPDSLEVVVFVNSGSEANDLALRLARAYTKSSNTIVVDGAYHGHTLSVLEVSPYKYEHSKEYTLTRQGRGRGPYMTPGNHIWQIPCPDIFRGPHQGEDAGVKYANYVKEACDYYTSIGEKVGALIMEGGMSVAGVILPPGDFVKETVQMVHSAGGVYIADEVQTGFGRLGSTYWAFEQGHHGIVPDIVTVGKPFGNGMSLGAVVTTRAIADRFEEMGVEYFNTFGGNPVSAAAGLAVMDIVEDESLQEHALEVGGYIKSRFLELQSNRFKRKLIGDIRGSGLFLGVELVRDLTTKEPADSETSFICTILKQKYSILTSIDGIHENVLVIKPPLVFSKADADYLVESFAGAVEELMSLGDSGIKEMAKTPT